MANQVRKVTPIVTERGKDRFIDTKYGFHKNVGHHDTPSHEAFITAPLRINGRHDIIGLSVQGLETVGYFPTRNPTNISVKALYFDIDGEGYRFEVPKASGDLTHHELTNYQNYICSYSSNIPANQLITASGKRLTEEDFNFFFQGEGSIHIERGDGGFFANEVQETFLGSPIIPIGFDLDLEFNTEEKEMTNNEKNIEANKEEIKTNTISTIIDKYIDHFDDLNFTVCAELIKFDDETLRVDFKVLEIQAREQKEVVIENPISITTRLYKSIKSLATYHLTHKLEETQSYIEGFVNDSGASAWQFTKKYGGIVFEVNRRPYKNLDEVTTRCWDWAIKIMSEYQGHLPESLSNLKDIEKEQMENCVKKEAFSEKTLNNVDQAATQQQVSDVEIIGNTDLFQVLCKASSKSQGWMKSTKAMEIEGSGCLVQVSTQQKNLDGSYALSEALTFIPNVMVVDDVNNGKKLVSSSTIGLLASTVSNISSGKETSCQEDKVTLWKIKDSLEDFNRVCDHLRDLQSSLAKHDPDTWNTTQDILKLVIANRENKLDTEEAIRLFNRVVGTIKKPERGATMQEKIVEEKKKV